jgi:hypothetical protein
MGFQYGIKTARETLIHLSRPGDLSERLVKAFSEIDVATSEDLSQEHLKTRKELREKYLKDFTGDKYPKENEYAARDLAESLVWLCTEIIEHNAKKRQ